MEIEARTAPLVAKKLFNLVRIVIIMLRKGISKSKLNLLLKRGKIAATNAISTTLTLHHHYAAAFTRRRSSFHNNKNLSFHPREYEFSCSTTPAFNHRREDASTLRALRKVLEMLKDNNNNNNNNCDEMVMELGSYYNSPLMPLPGFGKSPKQLRISDSPFPLKDEEDCDDDDGGKIDIKAEEFIKRFYKNLHSQHTNSPYYYSWDR